MNQSSFLYKVKWFLLLLYNSHNLRLVICLLTVCSILPTDKTLSGGSTPGKSGPRSNCNEGVLCIPQISQSYPGHSFGEVAYPSAEMQLVYFTADWAVLSLFKPLKIRIKE